ncbi:MAG: GerMN domain-containing protein [Spirochaetia bacterium]|nr:GerMN domain-containing protein [Spirochaetia bacterium]
MSSFSGAQKNILASSGAFFLLFFGALAFFLWEGRARINCLIFFPESAQEGLTGEPRRIHRQDSPERNVELLVREMMLGPMDIRHTNVFPQGTRLRSVFVRDAAAYLDFSPEILFPDNQIRLSFEELMAAIRRTVLFNFRELSGVVVTVNGQLPGTPSFQAAWASNERSE